MEWNFAPTRSAILIGLLVAFWLAGGFTQPVVEIHGFHDQQRVAKAWLYCVVLFISGAVCVSVIDHHVGTLDRSNFRLVYVFIGVALMATSQLWLRSLRDSTKPPGLAPTPPSASVRA